MAFTITYLLPQFFSFWSYENPAPRSVGYLIIGLSILFVITGIFFGFKSNHLKESPWIGYLFILIGFLIIFSPIIITFISFRI